jgi:oligopeptide/dipeptide ABC transporter ATP-binding protein
LEVGSVRKIFHNPRHPYTQGLLRSIPRIDQSKESRRLEEIPGMVPNLWDLPPGCSFHARCPHAMERCRLGMPELLTVEKEHLVSCWMAYDG